MEYKDLVKHHTQLIKDKNDNKWEVIETSDLEEICEAYHQHKLKLLGIADVSVAKRKLCPTCGSDSLITLSDITYCMNDCCDGVKWHN